MKIVTSLAAASALAIVTMAQADTTNFNINTGGSGEPSLKTIFGSVYGGSFNPVSLGSKDYTNGSVTLTRVADFMQALGPTGMQYVDGSTLGAADDNIWSDGTVQIRFETKYAGNTNTFGWYNNLGDPNQFNSLLGTTPGSSVTTTLSANFEWGLKTVAGSGTQYWRSNMFASGQNGEDHFVAYKVTGLAGGPRWLIAVEDLPFQVSDMDFNDWVGEITLVPLPTPAWMALAGLGLAAGLRMRRRV